MDVAPALAEGTVSVEFAGAAEKVAASKAEASVPRVRDESRADVKHRCVNVDR